MIDPFASVCSLKLSDGCDTVSPGQAVLRAHWRKPVTDEPVVHNVKRAHLANNPNPVTANNFVDRKIPKGAMEYVCMEQVGQDSLPIKSA